MAAIPTSTKLLEKLRNLMQRSSSGPISAYIVPSGDAHQSEYVADCDSRRTFISNFSGSAGTAIVTSDKAALWTDGRYFLQAGKELDANNWILMKDGLQETPSFSDWLKTELKPGTQVGVDPYLITNDSWRRLSKELRTNSISLVGVKENLIDIIWEDSSVVELGKKIRPKRPANDIINLDFEIHGKEWPDKVKTLRDELSKKKAETIILTNLDDVAWLLNLRGSDIDFNPLFFAYCIVDMSNVYLFVNSDQLKEPARASINAKICDVNDVFDKNSNEVEHVKVFPYDSIDKFVINHVVPKKTKVWISSRSSEALVSLVPKEFRVLLPSPVTNKKAIKNDIEIDNIKNCHVRDGAALCEYLAWLEATIEANPEGHASLWEIQGADYLENCRKVQERFVGLSFPTISSSGPNGAIIHYHPSEETRRPISKQELYLVDSGAQYLDGTTDVTRTVHFGEPTGKQRECFTRVLKGHIQLAMAIFPRLIKGNSLDSFARQSLWSQGLNYLHGTGHGVGMFLNVHEGPSSISPKGNPDDPGLEAGQILSNEPGYYEDGEFGIRIESLVVTRKAETKYNFNNTGFLKFETITFAPIQLKMIDANLLTNDEIAWLNEYHKTCRELVGAHLKKTNKLNVLEWLNKETRELVR